MGPEIFNQWRHSFEEDRGDTRVYRRSDFRFPLARGRETIEFTPDGTFVLVAVGRGDERRSFSGRWEKMPLGRVRVTFQDNARPPRVLEVIALHADRLELKEHAS